MARVRTILPAVALTLAMGLGVAPARADPRVDAIARALHSDPVFVSSATARSIAPA